MDSHVHVPITALVVGAFALVLLGAVVLWRMHRVRARASIECSVLRASRRGDREIFQQGRLRYGVERLTWYRAYSLRFSPDLVIRRREIAEMERSRVEPSVEGFDPFTLLEMRREDGTSEKLIVDELSASGLLAWLEAAPAGSRVHGWD